LHVVFLCASSDWRKLKLDAAPECGSSAGQRGQSQAGVVFELWR